ncbi:MAG TPA: L,D-transpeptidase family protein [Kiritimatiellia bacterium]|nr:L,D-transpeptidase family protein [Kiritimatiellia bacterium]HQG75183.1 L,D-transpeptidase family protein [Kiritimatiellia bacterium]
MELQTPPDIYLMKREKSRAGCMTALFAALIVVALAVIFGLVHWFNQRGTEPAEPVEFPVAPIQDEIPPVQLPDIPLPEVKASAKPDTKSAAKPSAKPAPAPTPAPATAPEAAAADAAPESVATEQAPAANTNEAVATLAKARRKLKAGDHAAARTLALQALAASPGDAATEEFLSELAMPLLASQRPMPEKVEHVVQSGDYLGKLAATYNTPVALIAKANNIQGATIRIGETLRLLDGNKHIFALTVSKSRNDCVVTLDGNFFKRYRVSTGTNNITPTGVFKIVDKIEHPPWHKPGSKVIPYGSPDNQLGTHWLAFDQPGYGMHGTWEPDSIGKQSSAGCVRLLNSDIEELYTILPKGTLVTIIE